MIFMEVTGELVDPGVVSEFYSGVTDDHVWALWRVPAFEEHVRVSEQTEAHGALDDARDLPAHAEKWGRLCPNSFGNRNDAPKYSRRNHQTRHQCRPMTYAFSKSRLSVLPLASSKMCHAR